MLRQCLKSKTKRKRKLVIVPLVAIALHVVLCDFCQAFLPQRHLQEPTPTAKNNLHVAESFRLQLHNNRDERNKNISPLYEKQETTRTLFRSLPRVMISTATAMWLFFGSTHAVAAPSVELPEYLSITERDIQMQANKKLVDYAVGTINTQYYDSSGGARFNPSDFYHQWRDVQSKLDASAESSSTTSKNARGTKSPVAVPEFGLDTRDGTVQTLKYLVSTLKDPYSKYMTREELQYELKGSPDGFLGTGAYIEVPETLEGSSFIATTASDQYSSQLSSQIPSSSFVDKAEQKSNFQSNIARERLQKKKSSEKTKQLLLTNTKVANLPVVTAIAPNSPAERAGLVVGDRIVGVGDKDLFLGYGKDEIRRCLSERWGYSDPNMKIASKTKTMESPSQYFGIADLTIAKPVYSYSEESRGIPLANAAKSTISSNTGQQDFVFEDEISRNQEIVLGYRSTKVKLPTVATDKKGSSNVNNRNSNLRGDGVVQYELLSFSSSNIGVGSVLNENALDTTIDMRDRDESNRKVGYIRLTRFSRSSTEGYLNAVKNLEAEGAESYVIDLRNNYGGVIQEAMLTASTLLGDQHAILCYLLNARGGFTPVDVESYVVDPRYPGYLLSKEDKLSVLKQTMEENPQMFQTVDVGDNDRTKSISDELLARNSGGRTNKRLIANWDPPSSYASIHEQVAKRGIHRITYASLDASDTEREQRVSSTSMRFGKTSNNALLYRQRMQQQKMMQKEVVLLINEGTASSAEFFVAALQDNGRSLAVVGSKSFGKGIIQHTFPMPDGGGLKLTIGEFLRPSLKHVTNAFGVGFVDKSSGEVIGGGGVTPDVYCESSGIPGSPRADLCVRVAVDVIEEHKSSKAVDGAFASTTDVIAIQDR